VDISVSWIDRINAAVLRRIARGRVQMSADANGVTKDGQTFPFADLERAVAYCHPGLVGDDLVILLDFGAGRLVPVTEHDSAWRTVVEAIDAHPRNSTRYPDWSVGLVADVKGRFELLSPRETPPSGAAGVA
jgi:hypothetical protein